MGGVAVCSRNRQIFLRAWQFSSGRAERLENPAIRTERLSVSASDQKSFTSADFWEQNVA